MEYTHPNTYKSIDSDHWYSIGYNEDKVIKGDDFLAHHIPKSTIDAIAAGSAVGAAFLNLAYHLATYFGWIPYSQLAALILAAIGAILAFGGWVATNVIPDESGGGWEFLKDMYTKWVLFVRYAQWDMKLGESMWFHVKYALAIGLVTYPLWYGGKNLGIGGI